LISIRQKFVCSKYFVVLDSQDNASRIKAAASFLVKGGTLTSEACPKCAGVQVRFADQITCINCGNVVNTEPTQSKADPNKAPMARHSADLASASSLIEEKIVLLASEISHENDISIQVQKAALLETYLGILEKMKRLMG
jgi:uncharacterized Zn finger protein (UPF0148 family)